MPCFNRRLRQLREEAGLSQQELSNQTGVTKSSINMYERGEREPGLETLEIFADYFNVDMNYLTGYQSQKHIRQISDLSLTPHEGKVITAYRDKPTVQPKVDKLLGVAPEYVEPSNVVPLPCPVKDDHFISEFDFTSDTKLRFADSGPSQETLDNFLKKDNENNENK